MISRGLAKRQREGELSRQQLLPGFLFGAAMGFHLARAEWTNAVVIFACAWLTLSLHGFLTRHAP